MTASIYDFKSIAQKLNRQEQKAEFVKKNPLPWSSIPFCWHSPDWGAECATYGIYEAPDQDPA